MIWKRKQEAFATMKTPRLIIRRFLPEDWQAMHAYLSDPKVVRYEPYSPFSMEQSKREAAIRSRSKDFWAVCLKEQKNLIGNLYLKEREQNTWELGYVFHAAYHGKGYATEASQRILAYVFTVHHAHRVIARCHPDNIASWRVMEKLSMRKEAHLVENIYLETDPSGAPQWQDTYQYALLKKEWEEKKR